MGSVKRVQLLVEVEADGEPGVITRYEVVGKTGSIYGRRTMLNIEPIYGNPGEAATQVKVQIDAMLIPIGSEQLVSITEHEEGAAPLPSGETIVLRELER